ncbi:hypothetical protein [Haloferula sp. A504]|uniref:hypothetical protein n=1 Tax=Haloferula sp. A504 TaxID=3373601 RepID=UPI0031C0E09D|nr:hypothetical protein [Verrucomicrobiaceae bacterium E54]
MSPRLILFVSAIGTGLLLPSFGQTFSADQTFPYGPNTYRTEGVYTTGNITFNDVAQKSGSPTYDVTPDFKETTLTLSDLSEVEVFDICAEMFVGPTGSSTYSVSEGFGPLTGSQESAARALFSNAISEFVLARDTLVQDPDVVGVAIQIAYWEIVEDPVITSNLSLDDLGAFPGDLSIVDFASGYSGVTADAVSLAETYLANVRSGTWTDQGGLTYYYADATGEQDRLWITTGVIPEPSVALLGLLGGVLLLRRRR